MLAILQVVPDIHQQHLDLLLLHPKRRREESEGQPFQSLQKAGQVVRSDFLQVLILGPGGVGQLEDFFVDLRVAGIEEVVFELWRLGDGTAELVGGFDEKVVPLVEGRVGGEGAVVAEEGGAGL